MKVSCCCFTCFVGENDADQDEQQRLIQEEERPTPSLPSVEREAALSPTGTPSPKHSDGDKERFKRTARIIKKYQVSLPSKYDDAKDKEELLSETTVVELKICIKIMARSDSVKVFVLEATNVISLLMAKMTDSSAATADEPLSVQVRTKLIPSEVRGHTRKYEVYEGVTGAMKFTSECVHTMTLAEFQSQQLRFRLYNVFKQKRDILLGVYILDLGALGIALESGTTNVIMQLHETEDNDIKPPYICETRLSLGSASGSSTQSSVSSARSHRSTIRRGDTKGYGRKGIPSFESTDEDDSFESKRRTLFSASGKQSSTKLPTVDETSGSTFDDAVGTESAIERVQQGLNERSDNLTRTEDVSADMALEAGRFKELSVRLREKYQKKQSKKDLNN